MLKVTKVNKLLRESQIIRWYKTGDMDYVMNGYFLIKAELQKDKYRKILGFLVEKFGLIPKEQEIFMYDSKARKNDVVTKLENDNIFLKLIKFPDEIDKVENTNLIEVSLRKNLRVFKGIEFIYINSKYTEMLNQEQEIEYFGKGSLDPIYACNKNEFVMLLPVRKQSENKYLAK